jgi:hypothetical protein
MLPRVAGLLVEFNLFSSQLSLAILWRRSTITSAALDVLSHKQEIAKEDLNMNALLTLIAAAALAAMVIGCESPRRYPPPPPPAVRYPSQRLGTADVKMLAKSGISDDVIISQIRNSRTVYHLSAAEILDLKDAGVSEKVIDFMINTPSMYRSMRPPPPPPSY